MGYGEKYRTLLEAIAEEADAIASRYFRAAEMRVERKRDGTAVTQADKEVEAMARAKVTASGLPLDVLGEEMGGESAKAPSQNGRARMIIDPIDGTEEFSRGIPTFGTLMGIEENGEIVAGMASAPELGRGTRWWAYRGEGAYRNGQRIRVSKVARLADALVFTTGTGPSKDTRGAREDTPAGGCGAQQPFDWRLLAAHAGGRRRGGCGAGLGLQAVGPGAAGPDRGRGGRKSNDG